MFVIIHCPDFGHAARLRDKIFKYARSRRRPLQSDRHKFIAKTSSQDISSPRGRLAGYRKCVVRQPRRRASRAGGMGAQQQISNRIAGSSWNYFFPSKLTCGDRTICCRRVACAGTRRRTGACNRMRGTSGGLGVRFGRRLPRGDGAVRPKATTRHGVWAAGVGRGIARGCWFWIAPTGRANQLTGRAGSST